MCDEGFRRRQQFLDEKYYLSTRAALVNAIQDFLGESNSDEDIEAGWIDSYSIAARYQFDLFILDYTAGEILPEIKKQDWGEIYWQFEKEE